MIKWTTGDRYWRLTSDGVAVGYPKLISHSWKGLPGNIDAAFTYKNGKTYFFKVWKTNNWYNYHFSLDNFSVILDIKPRIKQRI